MFVTDKKQYVSTNVLQDSKIRFGFMFQFSE